MRVDLESELRDFVIFEVERIFRIEAVERIVIDASDYYSNRQLPLENVFLIHRQTVSGHGKSFAFHSVDRILGVRKLQSFGMSQRRCGRDSNFSGAQHGFGYADFEGRIASTGKPNERILVVQQLQTQTDSVEKQFFLEEQVAMQSANEIDGFAFLGETFSFHETVIGIVRRIHGSGIVFVPKAGGQLRIFGRFAVVEQSFQVGSIRVITGGRRYEFVVERRRRD